MQFKNPELLYALFLLLIPIFIHLFQLRRFQKTAFTNVAFLKKVTIQTRKSSQLKKWLILLMRVLALACLILAFAQPFSASKTALNTNKETILYLDNSFSMQAKSNNNDLLDRAKQDLYDVLQSNQKITWFTNDNSYKSNSIQDFKNQILKIEYTQQQLSAQEVLFKAEQLFSADKSADKTLIYISDFQQRDNFPKIRKDLSVNVVQLTPESKTNISIDSIYISSKNSDNLQLSILLNASGSVKNVTTVSLFNDETLQAKTAVDLTQKNNTEAIFTIRAQDKFNGKIGINDGNLSYDDTLYFNIKKPSKINVLSINQADAEFLQRLFRTDQFEYKAQDFSAINYNDLPTQNLIILNELQEIPASLLTVLVDFSKKGGSLLIIPSTQINLSNYNVLVSQLGLGSFFEQTAQEKKITKIIFDHPLYKNVFEKQVVNFQYPKVNMAYGYKAIAASALLFDDGTPFLAENAQTFLFTAAINETNSNFTNSPLIVPTIYNIALQSLPLPKLYYTIGKENKISIPIQLTKDEILTFVKDQQSFIPMQQTKANSVDITTVDEPIEAGIYGVMANNQLIEPLSFNFSRQESNLTFANAEDWEGADQFSTIKELFDTVSAENEISTFWKYFAIFALFFLIAEMVLLKYLKN